MQSLNYTHIGSIAIIDGLTSKTHLNGRKGVIDRDGFEQGKHDTKKTWILVLEQNENTVKYKVDDDSAPCLIAKAQEEIMKSNNEFVEVPQRNCKIVESEEERFRKALISQDRDTLRTIMISRASRKRTVELLSSSPILKTSRKRKNISSLENSPLNSSCLLRKEDTINISRPDINPSDNVMEIEMNITSGILTDMKNFTCAICLNILYKPCIIGTCQHVFCFWCCYDSMNGLCTPSSCAICREEFAQFPRVFQPLHNFLIRAFPKEMEQRQVESKLEEERIRKKRGCRISPEVLMPSRQEQYLMDFVDATDLFCVACESLALEPIVTVCGNLMCRKCCISNTALSSVKATTHEFSATCNDGYVPSCSLCHSFFDGKHGDKMLRKCSVLQPLIDKVKQNLGRRDLMNIRNMIKGSFERDNNCESKITHEQHISCLPGLKGDNNRLHSQAGPSKDDFINIDILCDGCGAFPIIGLAFECTECSSKRCIDKNSDNHTNDSSGYNLCKKCYMNGIHTSSSLGRFGQPHLPQHELSEIAQECTYLHCLMSSNPELTSSQLRHFLQVLESGLAGDGPEENDQISDEEASESDEHVSQSSEGLNEDEKDTLDNSE